MPRSEIKASDVQPITLNNLLRARVDSGLNGLRLQAPDHSVREKAINALFQAPDPAVKPLIEAARGKETDPVLKARLDQLWALTALQDPDASKRLQAVQLIGERKDPQMRSLLLPLVAKQKDGTYTETDEKVRAAANDALKAMAFEQWKIEMIGTLFAGLSLGSILLLAALGLAITYGLIGVINMAHGEFLMIGAYATYVVQELFPESLGWSSRLVSVSGGPGRISRRSAHRIYPGTRCSPVFVRPPAGDSALHIWYQPRADSGRADVFWRTECRGLESLLDERRRALMPNLILPFNRITIMVFALTVVGIASLVLNRTRLGLYIRATTQNRRMAACSGIRTWQVDSYAFAFGAGIAGLGGCALSQIGNVGPDLGQNYIIDSFMVVVLGGVGQLAGTIIGAMGLGVISKVIEPFWGAVLAKIAVLVLIVLFIQKRPRGLFALKGRSVEV